MHRLAEVATALAVRFDGHMGGVARLLGGELMAEHRDRSLIASHFESQGFTDMKRLMQAVYDGVPVSVVPGGDLDAALIYGNHSSASPHQQTLRKRLIEDLVHGRVVVLHKSAARKIKHLRVSPLAVVESKDKTRVILDLSFGAGGDGDGWKGVNGDTCFETAPISEIGGVLPNILRQIVFLMNETQTMCLCLLRSINTS